MEEKKTGKIKDIRETVSGAVEILHQFRNPQVHETFGNLVNTAMIAKEIIKELKSPEMVKNIENIRLISDNINQISTRMQKTISHLEETGVIRGATGFLTSAKETMDSFGKKDYDRLQIGTAAKEMITSFRDLADEIKLTIRESNSSGAVRNIREAVSYASDVFKVTKSVN